MKIKQSYADLFVFMKFGNLIVNDENWYEKVVHFFLLLKLQPSQSFKKTLTSQTNVFI